MSDTPTPTPNIHSKVVTQQGSWLVMGPVSHPANINLNPPSLSPAWVSSSSFVWPNGPRKALGEQGGWRAVVGREPNWNHISSLLHQSYPIFQENAWMQTYTDAWAHIWAGHTVGMSTITSMGDFMSFVIVAILIVFFSEMAQHHEHTWGIV